MKKILDTAHVIGVLLLIAICVLCSKDVLSLKSYAVQVGVLTLFVTLSISALSMLVHSTLTQHYESRHDKWVNYLGTFILLFYFGITVTAFVLPEWIVYAELVALGLLLAVLVTIMICRWVSDSLKRLRALWRG